MFDDVPRSVGARVKIMLGSGLVLVLTFGFAGVILAFAPPRPPLWQQLLLFPGMPLAVGCLVAGMAYLLLRKARRDPEKFKRLELNKKATTAQLVGFAILAVSFGIVRRVVESVADVSGLTALLWTLPFFVVGTVVVLSVMKHYDPRVRWFGKPAPPAEDSRDGATHDADHDADARERQSADRTVW